jgi:hypothetical protein
MTKTKAMATVLSPLILIMLMLAIAPVYAPPPASIQNNQIRLTLGNGTNNQGICTIVGMAPVKNLARDIVWFGEYEYLSAVGPPAGGGPWPAPGLVPLWGPAVPRVFIGSGPNWYSFSIGPVNVGGVPVSVVKTVTLPPVGIWGYARIDYQILPLATISQLWLYYSIDYCDGPVTGNTADNMLSWPPFVFQPLSGQVQPVPMPTPPGGGLLVNTKATGVGVLMSWRMLGGSSFPIVRYCGYWNNGLYDTWTNGNNIVEHDDDGALAVNLGAVTAAGVVCNQIYIGDIFGDPQTQSPDEPPQPSLPLIAAAFDTLPGLTATYLNETSHTVVVEGAPVLTQYTFDASSSFDLNGTITSYVWDFGDGTGGTGLIVYHTYQHVGTYTVTLSVTDNYGNTGDAQATFEATKSVGGVLVAVNKLSLLAPYIGLASTTMIGAVATVVHVRRVKRRKEKQ